MDIFLRRQEHRSGQGKPREGGNNQIKQSMPLSSPSVWRADQPGRLMRVRVTASPAWPCWTAWLPESPSAVDIPRSCIHEAVTLTCMRVDANPRKLYQEDA
jgi:hypothetical protein